MTSWGYKDCDYYQAKCASYFFPEMYAFCNKNHTLAKNKNNLHINFSQTVALLYVCVNYKIEWQIWILKILTWSLLTTAAALYLYFRTTNFYFPTTNVNLECFISANFCFSFLTMVCFVLTRFQSGTLELMKIFFNSKSDW